MAFPCVAAFFETETWELMPPESDDDYSDDDYGGCASAFTDLAHIYHVGQ